MITAKLNLSYREWSEAVDAGTMQVHRERERTMSAVLDQVFRESLPTFEYMFEQAIVYGRGGMVQFDEVNDRMSFYPVDLFSTPTNPAPRSVR
jgi:hypothetical protein